MKKVRLSIKKVTPRDLIFIQIVYNCFIKWCIGQFGAPSSMNYVSDLITVILFVQILFHRMNGYTPEKKIAATRIIIIFFIYTVLNWLMHLYSPIYYLWGLRNTFRFYVFFIACTCFLEKEDISKIFNIVFWIFVLNLAMCTYQYFVLGKRLDYIAGFFGSTEKQGGNGGLMMISSMVCLITIVQYIETRQSAIKPIIAILGTLYIATIAEIKVLFILVIAIVALTSLFTKFTFKKLAIVLAIVIAFPVAVKMLYAIYPNFDNFFEIETILDYAGGESGYTGHGDIDRLSAIPYCFEHFLETPFERIFGFGMGAADGSTNFEVVTTEFFKENYNTHYTWFTVPFILIENGLLGLVLYWMVFGAVFKDATKLRSNRTLIKSYIIIPQIMAILMVFFSFHNLVIRSETMGYMCYTFLAIPYIIRKKD